MEHSAIGTALVSLDGAWLWTNAAMQRLLGYAGDELLSLTFQDITHPDDLASDMAYLGQLLAGDIKAYQMDKRYVRKDGTEIWAELSVSLARDVDGRPDYFISQVQDITDRKAADIERRRLNERLTLATQATQLGVWEWDFATDDLIWDDRMFALYGCIPGERPLVRQLHLQTVHPDDLPRVIAETDRARAHQIPFKLQFRIIHRDGRIRHINALALVVGDGAGKPVRMVGTNWDITESHELQLAAQAASEAQARFLASMSHEIRTPLNGVLGMAQAMVSDPLSPAQRARVDLIRESGETLLTILNDILDLSKVESGRMVIEEVDVDLERLMGAVHATFSSIAEAKGLSFPLDIGDAAGVYRSDPTRLRQILTNLISNALKFTGQGEVRVSAALDAAGLHITVRDTGSGIHEAALASIFERFTQADSSITRTHGGTGLGLAISRELARLLGGDVSVVSAPALGSAFTLTLPIQPTGQPLASPEPARLYSGPVSQLQVLVAEDNSTNRIVVKALLEQFGVTPTVVANGQEALEAWRHGRWDAILMDAQMPVLDGIAAAAAIRHEEVATQRPRTPIIALTANAMPHHRAQYARAGMDGFVSKPIEARALFAALLGVAEPADDAPAPARLGKRGGPS